MMKIGYQSLSLKAYGGLLNFVFFYLYYSDSLISNQAATVVLGSVGIAEKRKQFYSKKMATYYSI